MQIVIMAVGSLGDLHPYLAMGIELKRRGHEVKLMTVNHYRDKVEKAGLEFALIYPDFSPVDEKALRLVNDRFRGGEWVFKKFVIPYIEQNYLAISQACEKADLLISHPITQAVPIVATQKRIPWISTVLSPISFFSIYDPPLLPALPFLKAWHLGPKFYHYFFRVIRKVMDRWCVPIYQLRKELGLTRGGNPILEGQHSPHTVLALYSDLLGGPQLDWPASTVMTGFVFYDEEKLSSSVKEDLEKFLAQGENPIVFTLGSARIHNPGRFFEESLKAVQQLGVRAIIIAGKQAEFLKTKANNSVFIVDYLPFSEIFHRAKIIVHQGGIGTTAQALRAGKPTLIVPQCHDQPDNAFRVEKLGVARVLPQHRYRCKTLVKELNYLLTHYVFMAEKANKVRGQILAEKGTQLACDKIETYLRYSNLN